jgi:PAS domain S-box-containing protein
MKNRPTNTLKSIPFSNEEAFNVILNNLDEVFILVDKELRVIHITEQTKEKIRKNFGITVTKETSALELVAPERHDFILKLYEDVFQGRERSTITEVKTPLSGTIVFETHFKPARNNNGEIVGALISSKDITGIKKAEDLLKATEERWRFALEGGNQGVWDWDVQTGDIFFSDSYKNLYGYKPGDLKGRIEEWETMIHPDDRPKMNQAIDEHLASSDPYYESTYRVKTKEGNYKWVLGRGMLIRDENGKPVRMIGTHTDITQQVTAEQTYRLLFHSNPLPMWTYDLETLRILTVNDAAIDHYGYPKEEFLSMTIKEIRPAEDIPHLLELVQQRKSLGHCNQMVRHVKKSGELMIVELSTHILQDSNSVLVVSQDITSKIKSEEELRQSNERFLLASRASSDAIYDWDTVANKIYWSEGLQTLFGFDPKEVPVSVWENLIHPDDRKRVHDSTYASLTDPQKAIWKEEYRFARSDGNFSYVLDRGFIIRDKDQKAIRMIGSMQDITERKYAEEILSLERSVFELSNRTDVDIKYLVETLLKGFEEIHEEAYTSLLLLKEDNTIESFIAPRLPDAFSSSINGLKIGPEAGSCGTAMWRKETVIVEDINTDPLWSKCKSIALQQGLQSCWSLPIIHTSGKVMGSFAVYCKKIKGPSTAELNTLERIRNIIRILMEYHWSLDEIKKVNERFDIVIKATHDLIWDWNLEANIIYRDAVGLQTVYGFTDNSSIERIEQWISRIHPDDLDRVQKMVDGILQGKEQNNFDIEYRFKRDDDGTYSFVYDRGMILRNDEGKPVRMIGAAQNITERKNLEEELLRNELEKQKAINQATVDSQEMERTEIGKELHDNVNQILTTTKLYLDLALSNSELKDDLIEKSSKNIISVINEIRQLSRSLMDPTIGDLGLIDSVNDLIENINLTRKLHVSFAADQKLETLLNKNHKLTIFRILQEALNNAIKHAKAETVQIGFKLIGERIIVTIKDDGIGFDPSVVKMGAGLKNIQNRVYLIGGTHTIRSTPKKGCEIIINFPINKT